MLIERLLSWPVATVLLGLVFKQPLERLINRIDLFKGPGIEVSTPIDSAAKQLMNDGAQKGSDLLAIPAQEQTLLPISDELEKRRDAVLSYGGNDEMLLAQMGEIEANLKSLQFRLDSKETVLLLIRHLAATQILHKAEQLYRLIFGSQIEVMRYLNEYGPQPEAAIRPYFDRAKAESPAFYKTYTFENWIGFPLSQQAIAFENETYGISLFGRQFLLWLVYTPVPLKPY